LFDINYFKFTLKTTTTKECIYV